MRWRILALLFLARVGLGLHFQTLASVGDNLVIVYGLDYAEIGVLIGLFMMPGLVLALPAGYWGRFVSDRLMVVSGLVLLSLGGVISSFASDSWTVGLGRVVSGGGFLFTTLYFTKMIADWFDGREIATAMSILVMSWPFGIAIGQVGQVWLAEVYGWRLPFQLASAYCLIAAVGVYLFYAAPDDLPPQEKSAAPRLSSQEWRLLLCAAFAWAFFNAAYVIYLTFGPKVLQNLGQPTLAAAGIISVGSWLMILSGTICGQIMDRSGRRNTILTVCMGAAVLSLLLLSVPGAGLGASLLFGLVGMAPAGVIMALAGQALRPQVRAFGMGVFFTVYYAAMMLTPPAAGALLDASGRAEAPIWLGVLLFALVVPLSLAYHYFSVAPPVAKGRKA